LFFIALHSSPAWTWLTYSLLILWVPGVFIFAVWLLHNYEDVIEHIKARFTYPRTGYVAPPSYWNQGIENQRPPSKFQEWLKQHPASEKALNLAVRSLFIFIGLWLMPIRPGWIDRAMNLAWPWIWAAGALLVAMWLLRDYARKLSISKLYWIQIIGLPVCLVWLAWLGKNSPGNGMFTLALLSLLITDHIAKLQESRLYWIEIVGIPFYLVLLWWLLETNSEHGLILILLTPGIYLILKGTLLFVRHLYTHPVPQASYE